MSAVLQRTKQRYQKVIFIEILMLVSSVMLILVLHSFLYSFSFFLGALASLLPQCIFIYWVFFRKNIKNMHKLSAFYRGEALKWLVTILLVTLILRMIPDLNLALFFCGYFTFLVCNSVFPILFNGKTQ